MIGPPGTGKSFTIAQIILDAVARGQTVLLSSKMNKAVDVVVEKLTPHLGGLTVILRGGDRRYRDELKKFLDNLFDGTGAPAKPRAGEIEMLEERLRAADAELAELTSEIREILEREAALDALCGEFAAIQTPPYDEETAASLGPAALQARARRVAQAGWRQVRALRLAQRAQARDQLGDRDDAQLGLDDAALAHLDEIAEREAARANLLDIEDALARPRRSERAASPATRGCGRIAARLSASCWGCGGATRWPRRYG